MWGHGLPNSQAPGLGTVVEATAVFILQYTPRSQELPHGQAWSKASALTVLCVLRTEDSPLLFRPLLFLSVKWSDYL